MQVVAYTVKSGLSERIVIVHSWGVRYSEAIEVMDSMLQDDEISQPQVPTEIKHEAQADAQPRSRRVACFRSPGPQMLGNGIGATLEQVAVDPNFVISGLTTRGEEAIADLVPYLLCGEESAVNVFYREGRTAKQKANEVAKALMWEVASEEKVHEAMLARLGSQLPDPAGLEETKRRGHEFFVGMASPDPAVHFAGVAALDSGVCKIMLAMCSAEAVIRCPAVHQILSKVRREESKHVRVSRKYVMDLGMSADALNAAADRVCPGLADFLYPSGQAFEKLGIDADRLFRRIRREEI